jgi:hypothetical protein
MRLALSSAAAPGEPIEFLEEACRARGIDGLFLAEGTACAAVPLLPVAGVEADWDEAADAGRAAHWAALPAPVVVRAATVPAASLGPVARLHADAGGRLLVAVPTELAAARAWAERAAAAGAGLAWEVRPGEPMEAVPDVLEALRDRLELVRLFGGGPETLAQGGQGVGPLMARLTLARYRGMLVIGPSRPELHAAWRGWLRRRGGTGCGGDAPVQLAGAR